MNKLVWGMMSFFLAKRWKLPSLHLQFPLLPSFAASDAMLAEASLN